MACKANVGNFAHTLRVSERSPALRGWASHLMMCAVQDLFMCCGPVYLHHIHLVYLFNSGGFECLFCAGIIIPCKLGLGFNIFLL